MKITIDTDARAIETEENGKRATLPLYSKEAFELVSSLWVKIGWNEKYGYNFTWMGRPVIKLPEDIMRVQEVIYKVRPDLIVETGVAHGGSLVLFASLCKAMGKGRVVGIDIEIRSHNRKAIEEHELGAYISLIEGSSTEPSVVEAVKSRIRPGETVLVVLDSNHSRKHVLEELELYHGLVTTGSYIVATDGVMKDLWDVPRGKTEWKHDNPYEAAKEFALNHPEFTIEQPEWPFNESSLTENVTHWPGAWLRRSR